MSHYSLDGRLPQSMAEDVWLAPTAQVVGDVVLRREASIWFSAIVRGDNEPIVIGGASYECLDVFLATAGIVQVSLTPPPVPLPRTPTGGVGEAPRHEVAWIGAGGCSGRYGDLI